MNSSESDVRRFLGVEIEIGIYFVIIPGVPESMSMGADSRMASSIS